MPKFTGEQREYGDAIVGRMKGASLAGDAKKAGAVFKAQQVALAEATDAVADARLARDAALEVVSKADGVLDAQIGRLADRMAGASLGKRTNPFAAFGPHSPSELKGLPYGRELVEVRKLGRNLARVKPPAAVARALETCLSLAEDSQKALDRLARPQGSYTKALARRDALLPAWQKALDRFRILARAGMVDDPTGYRFLFAPAGAKKAKRRRKKPAPTS